MKNFRIITLGILVNFGLASNYVGFAQALCPIKTLKINHVSGQVHEVGDKHQPVENSRVELFKLRDPESLVRSVRTDLDGYFNIENVDSGKYRLRIHFEVNGEIVAPRYDVILSVKKSPFKENYKRLAIILGADCNSSSVEIVRK